MTIDLILILYAQKRVASTARIVKSIARFMRLRRIVIVVNGDELNLAVIKSISDVHCEKWAIQHDNSGLEFGAYQAGVDYIARDRPDRTILMNDTVGSHQYYSTVQLRHFCQAISIPADRLNNFVTGDVNVHERRITINGMTGDRWVRSNLVGLDNEAIARLGRKIYDPSIDKFITDSGDIDTFFGPDLDSSAKLKVSDWLFSTAPGKWYNAQPLSAANSSMMAGKARSFLQEQYLSMRLETVGTAFYIPRITFTEQCIHKGLEIMGM
jgi:hypothetical protein